MSDDIYIEEDLLGTGEVPANAYYGARTLRMIESFYINNNKISGIPEFVCGMVMIKKAAATTSKELQAIPKSVVNTIIVACDEVLNNGKCIDQFPVDVYQSGAGTSANININGVLANIGLELMGHQEGEYQYLNLNDHASKCQSTSDTYLTGFRIAAYSSLIKLADAINQLREGFKRRAVGSQDILKMGHAQLQDVVPVTLDREFRVFGILLKGEVKSTQHTAELLLRVNLGATAVGTDLNTPKGHSPLAMKKLAEVTSFPCVPAEDLIEAASGCGAYVMVCDALKRLAMKMPKICNSLRLLSSGLRAGLNEIDLPELQADSSIMPTKINPVAPEVVNQVRFKVIGSDTTVTMTAEAGRLQLSVMGPVIDQAMFESAHILTNTCHNLLEKCINGITANKEACKGYAYNSIGVVTYLNPLIDHYNGGTAGKICAETGESVREIVLKRGLLTEVELDNTFPVRNLMHPAYKAKRYTDENKQ